jgi:RNA polymerase sigma factor (sigma-70 family)
MLRGDEAQLFRDYELALRAAVRHFAHVDDAIVDDACSHAWLQLLRHQPDRDNAFAWLRTVAIREAWRLAEREHRDSRLDALPATREPGTDPVQPAIDAHEALRALAALPDRQRCYLTLIVSGCSYDEIVRHCQTTTSNVNKHLCRARRHLKAVRDDS